MERNRQLASILFADIAGYTAMMQKDESAAAAMMIFFQKQIEASIPTHGGRIIDFYGDGALCTFDNPLEAVQCAMVLQKAFIQFEGHTYDSKGIPVRIGIHSGTVVFQQQRIYGDSVNLASRIESISIPGAILFSKKVRDDIKNHKSLEITPLGDFEFKNVDEPMQVYALANEGFVIPKRGEMKGKLKEKSPNKSIAVLPFSNMSGKPEEEYFSDGITEEIIHALAQMKDLKVTGRTSAFFFKGKEIDLREIGQKLNVETVLEGSFRKAGNRIRITAQLIKVADGFHLWSERYDRELTDIFEVQDEIAQTIAEKLKVTFFSEPVETASSPTQNVEAYQLYLKGRFFQSKRLEGYPKALECFQQALELDPNYSPAYAGLAFTYFYMGGYGMMHPQEAYPKTREYMLKAISLNPEYQEGNILLAGVAFCFDRDWDTTLKHLSLLENEKITEVEFYKGSSIIYLTLGDYERAIQFALKAIELEPINPDARVELAYAFLVQGEYNEAMKVTEEMIELDSTYVEALRLKGTIFLAAGDMEKAIPYFEEASEMAGGEGFAPFYLAISLAILGKPELAREMLTDMLQMAETAFVSPLFIACIYGALKEMDTAYQWLDQAFEEQDGMLSYLAVEPAFGVLKGDKRFEEAMNRLDFPKEII